MEAKFTMMLLGEPESVGTGEFTYLGRKVSFDTSLKYSVEAVDCDTDEMRCLPQRWGSKQIFRVTLTSPAIDNGDFALTIK